MRNFALLLFALPLYCQSFADVSSKAAAARDANDIPNALRLYKQAVEIKPDWAEGWWFLGTLAYDGDQYAIGQDALTHFVKLEDKPVAWSLLGLCEYETGANALSLQHIQRALSATDGIPDEMQPALHFHEAALLTAAGLFDQALQKYIWFARKGSSNAAMISAIGLAALRTPLLPKDIPADKQELFSIAGGTTYQWMATNFSEADGGFQSLLTRFPSAPNVHYLYGSYLLPSRPDEAMRQFMQELQINPTSADALAMVALEYVQHEDLNGALPYAKKAVDSTSPPALAHYIYGLILSRTNDTKAGVEHLEQAEKMDPANLEYHIALAAGYSKLGRAQDSLRERKLTIEMARADEPHATH